MSYGLLDVAESYFIRKSSLSAWFGVVPVPNAHVTKSPASASVTAIACNRYSVLSVSVISTELGRPVITGATLKTCCACLRRFVK